MLKNIQNNIYITATTVILEGNTSLILAEPGCDAEEMNAFEGSSVEEALNLSLALHKPISSIILSHSHWDHVSNLSFYLERLNKVKLIAHTNNPCAQKLHTQGQVEILFYSQDGTLCLDGFSLEFWPTWGHAEAGDDLCTYLPKQKILLVGDMCQPQGLSYEKADSASPVPCGVNGYTYLASLDRLLREHFDTVITGHGQVLETKNGINAGRKALEVTRRTLLRMKELAEALTARHPKQTAITICEWIYDTVVWERNFDKYIAERRKMQLSPEDWSDYAVYDFPTIWSFVKKQQQPE